MATKIKKHDTGKVIYKIVVYFIMGIFTLIYLIPFYIVFITSIKATPQLATQNPFIWFPTAKQISLKGYANIFTQYTIYSTDESMILVGLRNTILIMIPVIIGGMFSSSIAAYAYAKLHFKGKKVMYTILMLSMMLPGIITLIPSYFIYDNLGVTEYIPWFPLVIPPMFGSATCVFFLRGYYSSIPNDLLDSAKMDGLGFFGTYFKVILPLAKPAIFAQGLLGIVAVYNDYLLPLIYLTREENYTLQIALSTYSSAFATDLPSVMAGAVMSTIPILLLYLFLQKYFISGLTSSGVKR